MAHEESFDSPQALRVIFTASPLQDERSSPSPARPVTDLVPDDGAKSWRPEDDGPATRQRSRTAALCPASFEESPGGNVPLGDEGLVPARVHCDTKGIGQRRDTRRAPTCG